MYTSQLFPIVSIHQPPPPQELRQQKHGLVLGVLTQAEPFAHAGGQGDHVLHGTADLYADDVL